MVMVDDHTLGILYENDGYRDDNKDNHDTSGTGIFFETIDLRPTFHKLDNP